MPLNTIEIEVVERLLALNPSDMSEYDAQLYTFIQHTWQVFGKDMKLTRHRHNHILTMLERYG